MALRRNAFVTVVAALALTACGGGDSKARTAAETATASAEPSPTAQASLKVDRFDEDRAWDLLVEQVEMGERPAGSEQSRRLAARLRRLLPNGRYESVPGGLRNVVGHIRGRRPAVLLGAHHDTKVIPGFVGAEDGAGGTAAVVEIARALRKIKRSSRAPEIRFVLFDGEECPDDSADFYTCGLRGSRAYARRHAGRLKAVIVVDFIAQKDLSIPRDASSDERLWSKLRAAARRVGAADVFPDETQSTVLDDHTPFLRAGVPSIDLIDFDFPCWHKTCDNLDVVSKSSLDKSGETVLEMIRTLR